MGQQPRRIDAHNPTFRLWRKSRWLGKEVDVKLCELCHETPFLLLVDASYTAHDGRIVNEGMCERVQLYCSNMCVYSVYTPLEGPTVKSVLAFWNSHGHDWAKTKIRLDRDVIT